ncbi:MAG: response regulator [Gammaproteobacteria bacterium]|nr:response regulator [Gammaproteobacteria bacterium]MYC53162.1 response regulator [Gammaproteobacteria bacterium]
MNDRDPNEPGSRASDDRASRLSAAILRISQSLDLATVLDEVVDSARALTGAGAGVITTIDERGQLQDLVIRGLSPHERQQMMGWVDGPRLFEHLRDLPTPLRVADLSSYLCDHGFSPIPWDSRTLQATPMHHRGEHLGGFFLGDKEDDEPFTSEDEEILVLFASQAATAIVNARTHREVERARADLKALVETSPVGVVVFDAKTGRAVSFNREAWRIVDGLRTPGQPREQILEVVSWRHADGREFSIEEFPLPGQFENARALRAEEIELSVPDGRSVRTLINATPIRSEGGDVVSVVVTMQDLAPLDDLERQRAEFLEMVSHEMRAPLTSIKGSAATALGAVPVPPQAELIRFLHIIDGQADHMYGLIANLLDAGSIEAGTLTVAPEPSSVAALVDRARNTFLSGGGRHAVLIDIPPDLPQAVADRERIVQVLGNLLSNAARNAPETTSIRIQAAHANGYIEISVSDEGRGIPRDRLPHLFRKRAGLVGGYAEGLTGGTGLGLAICKGLVEAHGGRIRAESEGTGQGARFTVTIPAAGVASAQAVRRGARPVGPGDIDEKQRILVVDDDPQTLRHVRDILSGAGYDPITVADPKRLSDIIHAERPRLVLLDLMLPGTNGIELMEQVPELGDLPVIFISGYGRDETIADALATGAVDYIVKPFSHTELVARARAALRSRYEPEVFVYGDLTIDYTRRRVSVAGREVALTAKEFDLLRILSVNRGGVVTTDTLLRQVWGLRGLKNTNRVRAVVRKLRANLGDDADAPIYIFTERGVGYRMASPGEA